ncbi:MAG: serine/threonine protein kinase [Candidatus Bathyarchaeia archaeon]
MKDPVVVAVEQLHEEPYASVLCYPKPNDCELQRRQSELCSLGVTAVEFSGTASAFGVPGPILGKGYVGIVLVAHVGGERLALKILRLDAGRPDLMHEAAMLKKANSVGVGPKLKSVSQNFLLTQLIDGDLLPAWLKSHREREVVRSVLKEVLEQCWRLDQAGLDHGELSKAPKHVIIDREQKPWLLDFETASDKRKPANVTAICNFLFTNAGTVATAVAGAIGERDRTEIARTLKAYRKERTRASFERVVHVCLD